MKFEINKIESIALQKKYHGIGVPLVAYIKNTKTPFSVDFGFGDIIVPNSSKIAIPTQLTDFKSPIINAYSIETTIAEKIDAIPGLMEFSSRMKDYYDIYYLANSFNFEGKVLTEAIKKTFKNRNHNYEIEQFTKIVNFNKDENMVKKWNAFIKKTDIHLNDFKEVLNVISDFLIEPIISIFEDKDFNKFWDSNNKFWKE